MNSYYNVSPSTGKASGVKGYEYGSDFITLYFTSGAVYSYSYASCGANHVDTMKNLADAQNGLNTYVTKYKPPFASKS
jgi:hypothetical protein